MACYFWVKGENFDVDAFLMHSPWKEFATVHRKGEPKSSGSQLRAYSSLDLTITDDDEATVDQQMQACVDFIAEDQAELLRLKSYPGVEGYWFSLAYYLRIGEVYAICPHFNLAFLSAMSAIGAEFDFWVMCSSAE